MTAASGATVYRESALAGLRPDPRMTITEWADERRYISHKASPEPGKYRSERTPYAREIQDSLSPFDPCQDVTFMKGTQLGGTEIGNNWIGYTMDLCPAPMIMALPTVELAKDHSQQKLDGMIADTPALRGRVKERRSRDSGNTTRSKEFPGGILFLIGANSPAGFRSKSIRNVFEDDVDGWPQAVGDEGDPAALIEKRTDTYSTRKKIFRVSTPTIKGRSRIERAFNLSDQRYYHVPCPLCGEMQPLEWGGPDAPAGIKFVRDESGAVTEAWYQCRHCKNRIDEHHKTQMLSFGRWVATHPERSKRGYHLSSLYSPLGWVSWAQIAQEFVDAKGDKEKLKTWINTRLALTFEEAGEQPEWLALSNRVETYHVFEVPAEARILTAGVDVQQDRLEVIVRAWGPGEESWLVYYGQMFGDPLQESVWRSLDEILFRSFDHLPDGKIQISTMAVDSGFLTQVVYNYVRRRAPRAIAIKGHDQTHKSVIGKPTDQDVSLGGKKIPRGVKLWPVGSSSAKEIIYARLKLTTPGPGCYHWPVGIPDDYFMQLTAEKMVTTYDKQGYSSTEWKKVRERNEALDMEVYAYAAALRSGLGYMNFARVLSAPGQETQRSTTPPAGRRVRSQGIL